MMILLLVSFLSQKIFHDRSFIYFAKHHYYNKICNLWQHLRAKNEYRRDYFKYFKYAFYLNIDQNGAYRDEKS